MFYKIYHLCPVICKQESKSTVSPSLSRSNRDIGIQGYIYIYIERDIGNSINSSFVPSVPCFYTCSIVFVHSIHQNILVFFLGIRFSGYFVSSSKHHEGLIDEEGRDNLLFYRRIRDIFHLQTNKREVIISENFIRELIISEKAIDKMTKNCSIPK